MIDRRTDPDFLARAEQLARERPDAAADLIARQLSYVNLLCDACLGNVEGGSKAMADAVFDAVDRREEFCPAADMDLLFKEEIEARG